jgi:tetratricopeptide (TPR) repeat protein
LGGALRCLAYSESPSLEIGSPKNENKTPWSMIVREVAARGARQNIFSASSLLKITSFCDQRRSLAVSPTDSPWWEKEILGKDLEKARGVFRKRLQNSATDGKTMVHMWQNWGEIEHRAGNVEQARKLFRHATRVDAKHAAIWQAWAMMEFEQKKWDAARRLFKVSLLADPKRVETLLGWAQLEKEDRDLSKARELLKRALRLDPTNSSTVHSLAWIERDLGLFDKAADLFRQAIALCDPSGDEEGTSGGSAHDQAKIWCEWALMEQVSRKDVSRAQALFEEGIAALEAYAPTKTAPLYLSYAILERDSGKVQAARDLLQQATSVEPGGENGSRAWHTWATMERQHGDHQTARRLLLSSLMHNFKCDYTYHALAQLEWREYGNPEGARMIFAEGTKAAPGSGALWCGWAQLELETGLQFTQMGHADQGRSNRRRERASTLLQEAVKQEPTHTQSWLLLAQEEINAYERRSRRRRSERLHAKKQSDNDYDDDDDDDDDDNAGDAGDAGDEGEAVGAGVQWTDYLESIARAREYYEQAVECCPSEYIYHAWAAMELTYAKKKKTRRQQKRDMQRQQQRTDAKKQVMQEATGGAGGAGDVEDASDGADVGHADYVAIAGLLKRGLYSQPQSTYLWNTAALLELQRPLVPCVHAGVGDVSEAMQHAENMLARAERAVRVAEVATSYTRHQPGPLVAPLYCTLGRAHMQRASAQLLIAEAISSGSAGGATSRFQALLAGAQDRHREACNQAVSAFQASLSRHPHSQHTNLCFAEVLEQLEMPRRAAYRYRLALDALRTEAAGDRHGAPFLRKRERRDGGGGRRDDSEKDKGMEHADDGDIGGIAAPDSKHSWVGDETASNGDSGHSYNGDSGHSYISSKLSRKARAKIESEILTRLDSLKEEQESNQGRDKASGGQGAVDSPSSHE